MFKKLERTIVEEAMHGINHVFGNAKTSFMGVSMLTAMPINVILKEGDVDAPTSVSDLIKNNLAAWVADGKSQINIQLTVRKEEIDKLDEFLFDNGDTIAYIVLHEFMHVMLLHNTKETNHRASKVTENNHLINVAADYQINLIVSDLLKEAGMDTSLNEVGMYDEKYRNMDFMEILYQLLEDNDMDESTNGDGTVTITMNNGKDTVRMPKDVAEALGQALGQSEEGNGISMDPEALKQALSKIISTQAGDESKKIIGQKILRVQADGSWFKQLSKKLSNKLYLATSGSHSTWGQKNITYRGIFKAPANFRRKKTIPKLILFIDQSGSVDDQSLGKLVDIVHSNRKRINEIELHIFDTEIVSSCKTDNKAEMMAFIGTRQACGGTSLDQCFRYMEDMNKKDLKQSVVMFVSDFYCNHPYPKVLDEVTSYMIHTEDHTDVKEVYTKSTCIYM